MILDFKVISTTLPMVDDGCYGYKVDIDRSQMEADGWQPDDYGVVITFDSPAPGALQQSYSGMVTYSIQEQDGSIVEKQEQVWVNFISKVYG